MREIIYLSLQCHHQNDSCVKMGSDESHILESSVASEIAIGLCLFLDRESALFYQQCNTRDV